MNTEPLLPLIIEPEQLEKKLNTDRLRIVDLCKHDIYQQNHIPGAVHLEYSKVTRREPPVMGLLPAMEDLNDILSSLGISPNTHVVAYDDEGGGKACRFLWTLEAINHPHYSLLNGGLQAWANEGHPLSNEQVAIEATQYPIHFNQDVIADKEYVLSHLRDPSTIILDTRSVEEFNGEKKFAARGGHIPGAVNMDWVLAIDQQCNLRFKSEGDLRTLLEKRGITPEKEIIVHCQTHHRSAHTYILLKSLGFPRIKGYAGSWSEWGNSSDTPVE